MCIGFVFLCFFIILLRAAVSASCQEPCCPAHIVSCLAMCCVAALEQIKMMLLIVVTIIPEA